MRTATLALCLMGAVTFGRIAAASEPAVPQPPGQAAASEGGKAGSTPRLKFRNGPSCMCAAGMSEADIQKAEQAQFPQLRPKQDDGGNYKK